MRQCRGDVAGDLAHHARRCRARWSRPDEWREGGPRRRHPIRVVQPHAGTVWWLFSAVRSHRCRRLARRWKMFLPRLRHADADPRNTTGTRHRVAGDYPYHRRTAASLGCCDERALARLGRHLPAVRRHLARRATHAHQHVPLLQSLGHLAGRTLEPHPRRKQRAASDLSVARPIATHSHRRPRIDVGAPRVGRDRSNLQLVFAGAARQQRSLRSRVAIADV